jgi:E3 ubiquitin-protein ligase HUWE1
MRIAASGTGSSTAGVAVGSIGSKELHYVLRVLSPAACRHPKLFTDVAKASLRIALPPPGKRGRHPIQLHKSKSLGNVHMSFTFL